MASAHAGRVPSFRYIPQSPQPALQEIGELELIMATIGEIMPHFFNIDPVTANPGMTQLEVRRALVE